MDRNLTRIIHNLNDKLIIKHIGGDFGIFDLDKFDIIDIKRAMKEIDKDNKQNPKWLEDRKYLVDCINKWCETCRCPSLYTNE